MPFSGPSAAALNAALTSSVGRLLVDERGEVDDRDVRRRHAHRDAVELALELRQHLADRRRRAGRRRDDRQRRRARAPQVLVRQVEQLLVVRVGVHRRHPALADAERLVQHLGDRREAVGRARRVRDDVVLRRVVLVSWLTPITTVTSGLLAGAVMMTFFAPAARCLAASSRLVKRPVDSNTTSTPRSFHGSCAGSFCDSTWNSSPSTVIRSPLARDVGLQVAEDRVVLQQVGERRRRRSGR